MVLALYAQTTVTALVAQANLQHGVSHPVQQAPTSIQLHLPLSMGLALHAQPTVTALGVPMALLLAPPLQFVSPQRSSRAAPPPQM